MKDYSLNKEESNLFILNYDVKNDQIIVNIANGKKYVVPYTSENESIILDKMERQVREGQRDKTQLKWQFYGWLIPAAVWGALAVHYGVNLIGHYGNHPVWLDWTLLSISGVMTSMAIASIADAKKTLNDLKKNVMFLDNKKMFKENIKTDDDLLTKENIIEETVTINDIHNMSKEEVEDMINLAKFNEKTGLRVSNPPVKKRTLTKKL